MSGKLLLQPAIASVFVGVVTRFPEDVARRTGQTCHTALSRTVPLSVPERTLARPHFFFTLCK
jgi:hypothetical protein